MTTLIQVLALHGGEWTWGGPATEPVMCGCGQWRGCIVDHTAHVAAAVTTWLASELAGAGMREAVARAIELDQPCNEHGVERCEYVYHWPDDEADLHRNGNWKSFTDRNNALREMRQHKRATAALAAVAARLGGGS